MSLLASLVFALSALVAIAVIRQSVLQYRGAALSNLAALRDCGSSREFRVQAVTVVTRQAGGDVRRIPARGPAQRRVRSSSELRAAA